MAEVNVSQCLLDCLAERFCAEGEPKTNVHNLLLEHGETWQDFMVVITALHQNFERFVNVQDIANFIEVHGREGVNTLYAALGEITALKQRFTDLEEQRGELDLWHVSLEWAVHPEKNTPMLVDAISPLECIASLVGRPTCFQMLKWQINSSILASKYNRGVSWRSTH